MIPGWLYASIFSLLLAACGGGSGGSDPQADSGAGSRPPAENPQPPSSGGEGDDGGGEVPSPEPTPSPEPQPPSSGGGDNGSGDSGGTVTPPSSGTDSGTPPPSTDSGSSTPPSEPTAPAFTAQLVAAPPTDRFLGEQVADDGVVTYADTVYFEVSGTGLRNVELVSANDTSIKYGTFTISADGTRATLDWDYQLGDENGAYAVYDLRVLAWDVPAGQAGESIEVMAPRRYHRRVSPGMCAVSGCVVAP